MLGGGEAVGGWWLVVWGGLGDSRGGVGEFGSLSARLVAPAMLSIMCSPEGQRLRGTDYFLANGATPHRGQGDVKW